MSHNQVTILLVALETYMDEIADIVSTYPESELRDELDSCRELHVMLTRGSFDLALNA